MRKKDIVVVRPTKIQIANTIAGLQQHAADLVQSGATKNQRYADALMSIKSAITILSTYRMEINQKLEAENADEKHYHIEGGTKEPEGCS